MACRIIVADVLEGLARLPNESVHLVITSPPYWSLRAYGGEPEQWNQWRVRTERRPTRIDCKPLSRDFLAVLMRARSANPHIYSWRWCEPSTWGEQMDRRRGRP